MIDDLLHELASACKDHHLPLVANRLSLHGTHARSPGDELGAPRTHCSLHFVDVIDLPLADRPGASILIPVGGPRTVELLRECLVHLARCRDEAPFETVLLLNGPHDEARSWIERSVRGARVLESPVNLGLAGGLQLLRAAARAELLISLHQDAEVEPGWLAALLDTATQRPDAGAIGSLVLEPDGSTVQAAGWILCSDAITFPPWYGRPAPSPDAYDGRPPFGVDYTPSSSLLVRAETWDAFGGPDDRLYPGYYVDVDLAMAVRSTGRAVLVDVRSRARHHRGSATTLPFRRFVAGRNRGIFLRKWERELEQFSPRADVEAGDAAVALARAEADAERLRHAWMAGRSRGVPTARHDAAARPFDALRRELERRCLEAERTVQAEYVASLEARISELERELATR